MTEAQGPEGIVEVRENIYQLGGAKGGGCKVYLLRGRKKNLLIDTGLPSDSALLARQLGEIGLSFADIHIVLLTHEHMDHIGGVPSFPQSTVVCAHALASNKIGLQDEFVLMNRIFGHSVDDFHISVRLHHGTVVDIGGYVLQTLHSPGHCSGAICFYEPAHQLLFTGDTIFAGGTLGGIFPSGNISDYIGSLQQLSAIKVRELLPGHGAISREPASDFEKAIRGSIHLMGETHSLFGALDARAEFRQIMKSVSAYSRQS
jgi:glyoxylase-like metal-dependent hydrolase (beta-lactamase superfamily II)